MTHELSQAFENSIILLRQGTTVEDCLARYPEQSDELKPLLQSITLPQTGGSSQVPATTRARIRGRVMSAWDQRYSARQSPWGLFSAVPRRAMATVLLALVLTIGGAGTMLAAQDSVPGNPLYPVKQLQEETRLWFARSPEVKAAMYTQFVRERANEIRQLAEMGRSGPVTIAVTRMESHIAEVSRLARENLASQPERTQTFSPTLLETLEDAIIERETVANVIQETLKQVPTSTYPCLQQALNAIQSGRQRVSGALESVGRPLPSLSSQSLGGTALCPQ